MRRRIVQQGVSAGSFASRIRALGAIAHFDPSWGATDSAGTSTWIDRIGGYTVSGSGASRLTVAAVSGFNNHMGWTGVSASSQRLSGAAALAALLDGSAPYTAYWVASPTTIAGNVAVFGFGSTTINDNVYEGFSATGALRARRFATAASDSVSLYLAEATKPVVASSLYSGAAYSLWGNASPGLASSANTRAPVCDVFTIGCNTASGVAGAFFNGQIGDLIIFASAHDTDTRRTVEQLIATKYGWPVLAGLSGFAASTYLTLAAGLGPLGVDAVGFWGDVLCRPDSVPAAVQQIARINSGNTGYTANATAGGLTQCTVGNGAATANSPTRAVAAADIGKLALLGYASNASLARQFWNGAEVGAGTALAGYQKSSAANFYTVGATAAGSQPALSFSIFGTAGGNVAQIAADQAGRAAAIKAAAAFVASGGATPSDGWALSGGVKASYSNLVGAAALSMVGTLQATQIIVPTWPW